MKSTPVLLNIILLSLILSLPSRAQEEKTNLQKISIGIHASPTYSTPFWGMTSDFKPAMGFITGVSGQYNFSSRWALHVELNYERSGYTVFDRNVYGENATIPLGQRTTKTVFNINNIQLPISMKFNFISKEKVQVFVNAGTVTNYSCGYYSISDYADGSRQRSHVKCDFTNTGCHSFGLIAGLGTDITLNQRMHMTLEARAIDCSHISYGLLIGLTYRLSK